VATFAGASLTVEERAMLERFAALLRERLGAELRSVWLHGSRARGEAPADGDSDVDLLVLVDDASWEGKERLQRALDDAARALGLEAVSWSFSVHIETWRWLAGRWARGDQVVLYRRGRPRQGRRGGLRVSPRSAEFFDAAQRRLALARGAPRVDAAGAVSVACYAMFYGARAALRGFGEMIGETRGGSTR
jgi:predicted nucleotidyltransferase